MLAHWSYQINKVQTMDFIAKIGEDEKSGSDIGKKMKLRGGT